MEKAQGKQPIPMKDRNTAHELPAHQVGLAFIFHDRFLFEASTYSSIRPYIYPSIRLFVDPSIHPNFPSSIYSSFPPSVHPTSHPSLYPSFQASLPSILSIHLSTIYSSFPPGLSPFYPSISSSTHPRIHIRSFICIISSSIF